MTRSCWRRTCPTRPPRSFRQEPPLRRAAGGLLASVSTLVRRPLEPELVEPAGDAGSEEGLEEVEAPSEDRIKARIADAIKLRARAGAARPQPSVGRAEPPVDPPPQARSADPEGAGRGAAGADGRDRRHGRTAGAGAQPLRCGRRI